jgi:hypothetical protein
VVRVSVLVRLAIALWIGRWAAMELAIRYAPTAKVPEDGPLPGLMPRRFE